MSTDPLKAVDADFDSSWLANIPNQSAKHDFQVLVNTLASFSSRFRNIKYVIYFRTMIDPLKVFLNTLYEKQPPEDVMVATLSGCIKSSLSLLILKKSGKNRLQEFSNYSRDSKKAVQQFVTSLQRAIRYSKEEKKKNALTAEGNLIRRTSTALTHDMGKKSVTGTDR